MKSDEEIERERAALEPLIGPTRAGWYADACKKEYDDPPEELLWACRFREMAMEAGRLEQAAKELRAKAREFRLRTDEQVAAIPPLNLFAETLDLIDRDNWKDEPP